MRNRTVWVVVAAAVLAALAGCARKIGVGEVAAAGPVEVKNIALWHYFEHEKEGVVWLAQEYNRLHAAEGVNIEVTYIPRDELMGRYVQGVEAGQLPDIGMVDSPDMASYIALGVFEDITDELYDWGELGQFYPGPLSSCMNENGRIFGLPNNSNCLALACNMTMLDAAGLKKPDTWEEFEAVCAALSRPREGIYGFAMSAVSSEEGTFQIIPWLYAAGGDVGRMDSPENIRALEFLAGLTAKGYMSVSVVAWTQTDAFNAFAAGRAAMVESGTWQVADQLPTIKDFRVEYAFLPRDRQYASVIGGENFGVCAGTRYKDICVDFLKFMETDEGVAAWCEYSGKLPVRADSMSLREVWMRDPYISVFSQEMRYAVARGPHPRWPAISAALRTAAQAAIMGVEPASSALQKAQQVVGPIVAATPLPN